jgi:hypothetical protein
VQDVQNVNSWRQLAVGGAFRHEQDAARADAAAVRDAVDRSWQIRRQLSLHRRHVTIGPAAAAAQRRRPNSSPGPNRPRTDAVAPPELPAALPPRDACATTDGEAGAAAAPAVRASSHQAARLHRTLGSAKGAQGSAKGMQGGGSTSLCTTKSTHASAPHLMPPAEFAGPCSPYAAESNLPRPRAAPPRAAPPRAAPPHRAPPRTKGEGVTNKAVTAVAVEGEGEGEGGGVDSSTGEGEGVAPVSLPAYVAVQTARRTAPLRVSPSAPVFTGPRPRSAGAAPAAHGTRGGPATAWLATHQNYLPAPARSGQ